MPSIAYYRLSRIDLIYLTDFTIERVHCEKPVEKPKKLSKMQ